MSSGLYDGGIKALAAQAPVPETLDHPDRRVTVDNPFCGDRIDLDINLEEGRVTALAQQVRGCMLCQAAANVVAVSAIGLSRQEVEVARTELVAMLKGEEPAAWSGTGWEPLILFEPVSRHKSRHGCVTLPFNALLAAL
ncbi:MAG: iron-sulfur cluster assembly scaffold protein [Halieaceae bacterium]|jgi:nitrogen fixation protein NifU and related proteins|nr:iron-sulfur cluster assembly scaffold protein [Halieaceae bacterium]